MEYIIKKSLIFILTCVITLGTTNSRASITYSNFDSSIPGYSLNSGMSIVGPANSNGFVEQGSKFTATQTGNISKIYVAAQSISGSNFLSLSLYVDKNDSIGDQLSSFSIYDQMNNLYEESVVYASPSQSVFIEAGKSYWLTSNTIESALISWQFTTKPTFDSVVYRYSSLGDWVYVDSSIRETTHERPGAFKIEVNSIPAPSSFISFALGLTILVSHIKMQRRILNNDT